MRKSILKVDILWLEYKSESVQSLQSSQMQNNDVFKYCFNFMTKTLLFI